MIPEILKDCELVEHKGGFLLKLPNYEIGDFAVFKNQILQIDGKWKNGKGFFFEKNPTKRIDWLKKGNLNYKSKNDFFATPEEVAMQMVQSCNLYNGIRICEPSAGQGVFIKCLMETFIANDDLFEMEVAFCEIDEDNLEHIWDLYLRYTITGRKKGFKLINLWNGRSEPPLPFTKWLCSQYTPQDFLKLETESRFDLIIGNPPFKDADAHIKKMISLLDRSVEGACSEISIILPMSYAKVREDGQYIESEKLLKLVSREHEHFTFYTSIEELPKNAFGKSMANVRTGVFNISGIIDVCEGSEISTQASEILTEEQPATPIAVSKKKCKKEKVQIGLF